MTSKMLRSCLFLTVSTVLSATAASAQDPFTPSERWTAAPAAQGTDWTPEDVRFAGAGAFIWSSLRGGSDSLHLYDSVAGGAAQARGTVPRGPSEFGVAQIAAGSRGDRVYSLRQAEAPSSVSRMPVLEAFDPRSASGGGQMLSLWAHDMGPRINGPAKIGTDSAGNVVVGAVWNNAVGLVQIDVLDGTTGAVLSSSKLPAIGLSALDVSADGSRLAVACGLTLYVLEPSGQLLHTEDLNSATSALSLSANGSVIAFGEIGGLRAISDPFGFGYAPSLHAPGVGTVLPTRVDVSADGTMMAVAWWNYVSGKSARFEIFDTIFGFALGSLDYPGLVSSRQNLPTAVRISDDGFRAAFASWGNGQDAEVVLLDAGGFGPAMAIDVPGSVRGMDLDATSTRIAIAHKDVHAQLFGSRGAVRLADTGERSFQVTQTPTLGGELGLVARAAGAAGGFFLLGPIGQSPLSFPGATGALLLDRQRVTAFPRPTDSTGRMEMNLPIGVNPRLRGVQLNLQAAFRGPAGLIFSPNLESPFMLD